MAEPAELIPFPPPERDEYDSQWLNEAFRLDLNGYRLKDPAATRGRLHSVDEREPMSMAGNELPPGVRVYDVRVIDPYVEIDPEGYGIMSRYVDQLEGVVKKRGYNAAEDRREASNSDEYNDFTKAWLQDASVEAMLLWRDLVPTAEALFYLNHPHIDSRMFNTRTGEIARISRESALQLRFGDDAIGIRDRAVAMQALAESYLQERGRNGNELRWLSLASGTADTAIAAAKAVMEDFNTRVKLTVTDIDSNALAHVESNAKSHGFDRSQLEVVRANIVHPGLESHLARRTGRADQRYDVVENMGFLEYLPQNGDELEARRGRKLPQASEFTRMAFELVKPGGILISGNMVYDRPQFDFFSGVVDWPLINARSEESILRIYKEAGILDDPNARVELFRVIDHLTDQQVYDIVRVTKLAEAA